MIGIKIGVGIVAGIVLIQIVFWIGVIAIYGLTCLAESIAKMWRQRNLK